jgi:hypothetical protein
MKDEDEGSTLANEIDVNEDSVDGNMGYGYSHKHSELSPCLTRGLARSSLL